MPPLSEVVGKGSSRALVAVMSSDCETCLGRLVVEDVAEGVWFPKGFPECIEGLQAPGAGDGITLVSTKVSGLFLGVSSWGSLKRASAA